MTALRIVGLIVCTLAAVGLAGLGSVSSASAQAGPERAHAEELFREGNDALREGRFAEAQRLFRQSIALFPRASSAFNLALSLRGTGELVGAERVLERLLAESFGPLSAGRRASIESLLAEVSAAIGGIRVTVRGATRIQVRIDGILAGELADRGVLEHRVDPGERLVTASADRRTTAEMQVRIAAGATEDIELRLELTEEASRGRLVIEAADPDHGVEIVGVARARGRLERALAPGRYRVALLNGDARQESEVELEAGQTLLLPLTSDDEGEDLATNPWLWLGIGAVVVGLVVAGIVLFLPVDEFQPDDTWGITTALR
ncbi:MAG: tetratricopeptide repeat protein [Sandaracinaceae bacterium]